MANWIAGVTIGYPNRGETVGFGFPNPSPFAVKGILGDVAQLESSGHQSSALTTGGAVYCRGQGMLPNYENVIGGHLYVPLPLVGIIETIHPKSVLMGGQSWG